MSSMQPVSRPILAAVLQGLYKDGALAMAAYVRPVADPTTYTEEETQQRVQDALRESEETKNE